MYNINGLRRYNEWLNYKYIVGISEYITRYCASVLSQEGTGDIPSLNWHQKMKCYCLIGVYGPINYFLGLPVRTRKILARGNPYGVSVNPFTLIFADFIQSIYKLAKYMLPDSTKNSILRFEKAHASVRHLRRITEEGKLFTKSGMHHLLAVGSRFSAKAKDRLRGRQP